MQAFHLSLLLSHRRAIADTQLCELGHYLFAHTNL